MMELLYLIGLMVVTPVCVYASAVLASHVRGLLVIAKRPGCTMAGWQLLHLAQDAYPTAPDTHRYRRYGRVVLTVALVTLFILLLQNLLDSASTVMLFLLAVVFTAIRSGRKAAVLAALLSAASCNFFFISPRFAFVVPEIHHLVAFAVMLTVALVVGQLTAGLRFQLLTTRHREQRMRALYEMAKDLSSALCVEQIVAIGRQFIEQGFHASVAVFVPGEQQRLQLAAGSSALPATDLGIVHWCFDHGQNASLGTNTLPSAPALYVPLKAPTHLCGVLVVRPASSGAFPLEQQQLLDTGATLIAIALERLHFVILAQDAQVNMASECVRNTLLQESETWVRSILEAAPDAILALDARGYIDSINAAGENLFGYYPGSLFGKHISQLLPTFPLSDNQSGAEWPAQWLQDPNLSGTTLEVDGVCHDAGYFPVEVSVSRYSAKGNTARFTLIVKDITERKQAKTALAKAYDELEQRVQERTRELEQTNAKLFEEIDERIRAEQGLQLASKVFETATEGFLITDARVRIIKTNASFTKITGYKVAVNLSALQFQQGDLVALVQAILEETGLPAAALEMEITESMVMGHVEKSIERMRGLKALGLTLAMDDFGTGYSSLNHLKQFPIDTLKIDQSFIRDLGRAPGDLAIVLAILSLGQALNLNIVAEGVETQEHVTLLKEKGCHEIQGYFFSKPLPAHKMEELLLEDRSLEKLLSK
ncbi:MAG: EAL domain-containing protein [Magnetococcales bacterium]|nr:EAL domain-containing protein [Magnetococcales bacterium]